MMGILVILGWAGHTSAALIAHHTFEDGSGTTATDSQGSHHGTLMEGGTPGVQGPTWTTGAPLGGSPSGGLSFDGLGDTAKGDSVKIPNAAAFDMTTNDEITVAAWVKYSAPAPHGLGWDRIVTKGIDSAWGLSRNDGLDAFFFYVHHPGGTQTEVYGTKPLADGKWHHVAGVFDGTKAYLYVDGQLDLSVNALSSDIAANTYDVGIGQEFEWGGHWAYWSGEIDEVRIYDDAQTQAQIQTWSGIPEPVTLCLLSLGGAMLGWRYRDRVSRRRPT